MQSAQFTPNRAPSKVCPQCTYLVLSQLSCHGQKNVASFDVAQYVSTDTSQGAVCMTARPTVSSQNHLFLQVLDAHAWQMPNGNKTMLLSKQKFQLSRQAWPQPRLPRHCSQPSRPSTLVTATAKPAADTDAVRAEFSKAGIPDEVIAKALKCYKTYLRWDPDTKLRPALQLWLTHLGSQQLSERLNKYPQLLLRTPDECSDVYLWLASVGIDAARIQQKAPMVMARKLHDVQSTVQAIQQGLLLVDEELPAFFKRHLYSLRYSPDRVAHSLQVIAELLAVPVASEEMRKVILVCSEQLFNRDPAALHQRVSFFCKEFKGGRHAAKAALKQNVYQVSEGTMRARAAELKAMLGWIEDELNACLKSFPRILSYPPATVANNIQKLQMHSFTHAQALKIYTALPAVAGYDWRSPLNVEKMEYLTLILQLTTAEIAAKPVLLGTSLEQKIGPRSEFIYRSQAVLPDTPLLSSGFSSWLEKGSDANFAARFNSPSNSPPLIYDANFKRHWQHRWGFLKCEMGLSTAEISACRTLLYTSLPDTLAPRWRFLTSLQATQAGFKAADHLTALATLSDEHFAQTFDVMTVGLAYDKDYFYNCVDWVYQV